MPDATYVGAGTPCGNCGNPLTPGQPHKCGRTPEQPTANPYRKLDDEFDHAAEALTWDEGFAAGRAAERAATDEALRREFGRNVAVRNEERMSDEREADIATLTIDYLQAEIREVALDVLTDYSPEDPPSDADIAYAQRQADAIASRWAMHRDATFADETLRVPASSEPRPEVRDCPLMHGAAPCPMCAYCPHGLTAGRGADERCLECGASVTAASPDERLREAAVIEAVAWSLFPDHPRPMSEAGLDCARRAIDTALFAAADREAPDEET